MEAPMETAPPPAQAPHSASARRGPSLTQLLIVVVILALVVVALGAALLTKDSGGSTKRAGELFLEPARELGAEPFITGYRPERVVTPPAPTPPTPATAISSVPGSREALYGGSLDTASCNKEQLIGFLGDHSDKAAAWAAVQGIRPSEIRAYINSLTSVILLRDTRVTNHGFSHGRAMPRQAVLQRGTAVLVDDFGVPRARCYCGNPLGPPRALSAPVDVGPRWPGYEPTRVIVVVARVEVETFVLVDVDTGERFGRPAGSNGPEDVPVLEDGDAGPGPTPEAAADDVAPRAATPSGTYTVEFSGEQLSPPCSPWGAGTGSMDATVAATSVGFTLHGLGGTVTQFAGAYDPATQRFSAPDLQYGATELTGTFERTDGSFIVTDGRSNGRSVNGGLCIGAFTATQDVG